MSLLTVVVWAVAVAALLWAAHQAALWAERRGWIYYRTSPPPPGAAARAANTLAAFVQPEAEYVLEAESLREEDGIDGP